MSREVISKGTEVGRRKLGRRNEVEKEGKWKGNEFSQGYNDTPLSSHIEINTQRLK